MRRGTLATTINGISCTVEYECGDPLPETGADPYEQGRAASWLEKKLGNAEWMRIREDIEEREKP